MRYGSVCSGIEAASVAWHCLGWQPAWFVEIEKFPSAVLVHHWPNIQNLGDMIRLAAGILAGEIQAPDLLVSGTPCQAFSVAGLRSGLADARGQLTLAFVELVNAIDKKALDMMPSLIHLLKQREGEGWIGDIRATFDPRSHQFLEMNKPTINYLAGKPQSEVDMDWEMNNVSRIA